jgi:hypothetical protein
MRGGLHLCARGIGHTFVQGLAVLSCRTILSRWRLIDPLVGDIGDTHGVEE